MAGTLPIAIAITVLLASVTIPILQCLKIAKRLVALAKGTAMKTNSNDFQVREGDDFHYKKWPDDGRSRLPERCLSHSHHRLWRRLRPLGLTRCRQRHDRRVPSPGVDCGLGPDLNARASARIRTVRTAPLASENRSANHGSPRQSGRAAISPITMR